ncbi:actin maturation protease [Neosynchiropus ocellatus]
MSVPGRPPPPPVPPPPPPLTVAAPAPRKKLYQTIGSSRSAVEGDYKEACLLIKQRENSFRQDLQWVLRNTYVPSLIQDGPQCGLVALWMATQLGATKIDMDAVTQMALKRGFTAQGEMFSARNMALLAEEVCGCRAELLSGGLGGNNAQVIVSHLWSRQPVLIPYDEDFNHEPCQRDGHRAHWAVASGVLVSLDEGVMRKEELEADPTLPWLYLLTDGNASCPFSKLQDVYVLAKQGKSLRYQIWKLDTLAESNKQLKMMDPERASDGTPYVVPDGGVEAGLAGQAVLIHTRVE